jgi:formamidopyrimidine-DNA glycosylase
MPELPEVETVRRQLDQKLSGAKIRDIRLFWDGRVFPRARFQSLVKGKKITSIERRAKLLVWRFSDGTALIAHLKMTGRFVFVSSRKAPGKHDHVLFSFVRDGKLSFLLWSDVRKFGFLKFLSAADLCQVLDQYGPEPLETAPEDLAACFLEPKTRTLKAALLDQSCIAGVGNIYADEACHRAGIRPMRRLKTLTKGDRLRLAGEIQAVLRASLKQKGTSANDYVDTDGERGGFLGLLQVYGRTGESCLRCGPSSTIKRTALAGRGTHYCPRCQK